MCVVVGRVWVQDEQEFGNSGELTPRGIGSRGDG